MPIDHASRFRTVAAEVLEALLITDPVTATILGDHRYDARLPDLTTDGVTARMAAVNDALADLDRIDEAPLSIQDVVDLQMLRNVCAGEQWSIAEVRQLEWDPILHLPNNGIVSLLTRPSGDPEQRAADLAARLRAVPVAMANARDVLRDMPRIHMETAIGQAQGVRAMLVRDVDVVVDQAPTTRPAVDEARVAADGAIADFAAWLTDELPMAQGDPRLGAERYAARLWFELDSEIEVDTLLTMAESDLRFVEEQIAEVAGRLGARSARGALKAVAAEAPVTDVTILPECERMLAECSALVRQADWVTVYGDPLHIVEMPESRRGVWVIDCDPSGPLEPEPRATLFAVSPTPPEWAQQRVSSFYREYNAYMLRDLIAHEVMPGRALQVEHARRFHGSTATRAVFSNKPFIHGWSMYAEELVATRGPDADSRAGLAIRLHQLKMALRTIINAILDIRVHSRGMTEAEAMRLMMGRGHQEEGEAAAKWRRALLTAGQLPAYYAGYIQVAPLVRDLAKTYPEWSLRQVHDSVLAHGAPAPRHLRRLLGL